jgi:hypothetical protein
MIKAIYFLLLTAFKLQGLKILVNLDAIGSPFKNIRSFA